MNNGRERERIIKEDINLRSRETELEKGRGSNDVNTVFVPETLKNFKSIILGMAIIENCFSLEWYSIYVLLKCKYFKTI